MHIHSGWERGREKEGFYRQNATRKEEWLYLREIWKTEKICHEQGRIIGFKETSLDGYQNASVYIYVSGYVVFQIGFQLTTAVLKMFGLRPQALEERPPVAQRTHEVGNNKNLGLGFVSAVVMSDCVILGLWCFPPWASVSSLVNWELLVFTTLTTLIPGSN